MCKRSSPLALFAPVLLSLTLLSLTPYAASALNDSAPSEARVIVKYQSDSKLLRKALPSVPAQLARQAQALGARLGIALVAGAGIAQRTQVVVASGVTSEELAQRI